MNRRLQNQRGASLSMALLLFLVCTVLGAAVLVAGTAAAGRMAGIAKSDQRYYSVTSAARLFQEKFDSNVEITVERTHKFTKTETLFVKLVGGEYQYSETDADGNKPAAVPDTDITYENKLYVKELSAAAPAAGATGAGSGGTEGTSGDPSGDGSLTEVQDFIQQLTCELVLGNAGLLGESEEGKLAEYEAAFNQNYPRNTTKRTAELSVSKSGGAAGSGSSGLEDLDVDIEIPEIKSVSGSSVQLDLVFANKKDDKTPQYRLKMTLVADAKNDEAATSTEEVTKTEYNGTTMTVKKAVTEKKTTSVVWHVVSLAVDGKGSAA